MRHHLQNKKFQGYFPMRRFLVHHSIIIIIITVVCFVKMFLRRDPAYVRFVWYNLKVAL